ncbi:MAG: efflux RND transporter periplasmic adaptor subunit [Gillisia sp.]
MTKLFTLLVFTLLFISCGDKEPAKNEGLNAIKVEVSKPSARDNGGFVTASGKIEAKNSAEISTRMMGYVTNVKIQVGQKVKKGQSLMSINNADLLAKKAQAEANISKATAAYKSAKKDYDRFVSLFAENSASQKELDDMTAHMEMAKAELEGAKQMRNEVMAQFSYSNITAPFSGIITNTFVKEGDMANPGQPLVSLEGTSKLQVSAMVSEGQISDIKEGMPAKVLIKSLNKEVEGKVSEVSLSAKNTGGQYLVKIDLDESDPSILSGMFVNVQFPIEKSAKTTPTDLVLVPKSALVTRGQLTGIYTVGTGNVAILRWLRTGETIDGKVEVLSGLSADEQYIVSADGRLFNGAKVNPSSSGSSK